MRFFEQRKEKKQIAQEAEARFRQAAGRVAAGNDADVTAGVEQLRSVSLVDVPPLVRASVAAETISAYAGVALADDILTEQEEQRFIEAAEALGIVDLDRAEPALLARLLVAKVNDGRLMELESPERIIPKRGEIVHLQAHAGLLKEVAIREWQGGSSGVSFRIAKGVSYRTGAVRGKSVVVGSEIRIDDTGLLTVTSTRVCFLGDRKTVDIPYTKLVGLDVFSDGVTLRSSSRQNAVPFRLNEGYGEVVAATINGAMQSLL
jgi:hypothetical protein